MHVMGYTEPETGNEYTSLPDPWKGKVSPLNENNCESFGWTKTTREVPDPEPQPVLYSKLKLIRAMKQAGIWTQVKDQIEASDYWDEFICAQELASNDPGFMAFVDSMKSVIGNDTINQVLEASTL